MKSGRSLFIAALLWLILGVLSFFFEPVSLIWLFFGLGLLPFIILDALFLIFLTSRLQVERDIGNSLALGENAAVKIRIRKGGRPFLPARARLFDIYPDSMSCTSFPAVLDMKALKKKGGALVFEYPVLPLERGEWEFQRMETLSGSPLGFWLCKVSHPCISRGRTYPDFKKLAGSGNEGLRGILERTGLRDIRKRGQGLEFQSLREYQQGDPVRHIDWRATSRRQKIIIREYQEEQDQQVLFILDSGYRLHRRDGDYGENAGPGYTQFDSALNAALLLAYVALKHGDGVAAMSFGAEDRWIPPRKGMSTLTTLMNGLYDLKSSPVASSLFSGLENALSRLHRRTFIILISNFREEDGESLSWILQRIGKRHLLLLVSFRELEAEDLSRRHPANSEEALETAAAFSYLAARRRLYKSWEHSGLLTLETSPADISSSLINRYLSVKRSGIL